MNSNFENVTTLNSFVDILSMQRINKMDGYTPMFLGVIQWSDKTIPIINLTRFSETPVSTTKATCILILEILLNEEKLQLGILVDSTKDILNIKNELIYLPADFKYFYKLVTSEYNKNYQNEFNPFCFS
ncbi:MAG: chemotaxis protein CheW [Salinivirgaceae bacterium]|nr:chemotaxis protein CheW [Salinivirgaceae bacterium]